MGKRVNSGASAMIVAENIRNLRKKLGLTVKIAADRCHLAENELMKLESGAGVFDNAITLLKVAEGYNVDYQHLYDNSKGKSEILNANVPVEVYRGIHRILKERSIKVHEFCEMVGCRDSAFYYWVKGNNNSTVLMFANMLNLLQLNSSDLEKMVKEFKPVQVVKPEPVEEPKTIAKPEEHKDAFEDRVLKIMRLQKNIGEYVKRLETIIGEVNQLREELVMLQEQ